jgi:hypothetical protein
MIMLKGVKIVGCFDMNMQILSHKYGLDPEMLIHIETQNSLSLIEIYRNLHLEFAYFWRRL